MSKTVDTRTVEMRFDNKNFESNVKQSMTTLEKLKRALKLDGASKGLKEIEKNSKKLDFKDASDSVDKFGKKFSALETIATGVFLRIGMKVADLGVKITKSLSIDQITSGWDKYAQKTSAVQTIMANLNNETRTFINESDKMDFVTDQLGRLMKFSDETSYHFSNMVTAAGKFISGGQSLEDTVTAMEGIASMAAFSGMNPAQAEEVFNGFAKSMTRGYMSARDFYSVEKLFTVETKKNIIAIGEQQGKIKKGTVTINNFRDSFIGKGSKTWLDKDVLMEAFKLYGSGADAVISKMEEMDAAGKSISSTTAIEMLAKENKEFAESIGFRAFRAAQEAKTLREAIDATSDAVSTKWSQIFENIFGNYLEAKELWTNFSEDLWDIFAAPLDTLGAITELWKKGFRGDSPLSWLDKHYDSGDFEDIEGRFNYVSKAAAELAVSTKSGVDGVTYTIETLEDGSQRLIKTVEDSSGHWERFAKKIYDSDRNLVSGRELLFGGLKNILDILIHDVEDEEGNIHLSLFGAFKKAFSEVFFGGASKDTLAKRLWELTKRFKEFTERIKPTAETIEKIKNSIKGFLTIFKIVYKFVSAIIKPFTELFGKLFRSASKSVLDVTDGLSTWIQNFEKFLEQNKVFEKISNGIRKGLSKIGDGFNWLSKKITGLPLKKYLSDLKNRIANFFKTYNFKERFEAIGKFFRNIVEQIKQVETDDLPDKLTPLQNFWIGLKKIFDGIKKFFSILAVPFRKIGEFISNLFTKIREAFTNKKNNGSTLSPIWEGIKKVFKGIVDFFKKIGPALEKIGQWIGDRFRDIGNAIADFAKDHDAFEIIEYILKGGFLASITRFIWSISSILSGTGGIFKWVAKDLKAIKGVFVAYQREVNATAMLKIAAAIGTLAGSLWLLSKIPKEGMETAKDALKTISIFIGVLFSIKEVFSLIKSLKGNPVTNIVKQSPLASFGDLMANVVQHSIFGNDATAKFVKICLGILLAAGGLYILVSAIKKIGDLLVVFSNPELKSKIAQGAQTVLQIILAFSIFAFIAGISNKASAALFAAIAAYILVKAISKIIDLMADLGGDAGKMANIRKVLDEFKDVFEKLEHMAIFVLHIVGLIAIVQAAIVAFASFGKANTLGTAKVVKQFGKTFTRIALSLVVVTLAFAIMASLAKHMQPGDITAISLLFLGFVAIVGILQAVAIGLTTHSKTSPDKIAAVLKQFGKNFVKIALSLFVVAAAFALFSLIKFKDDAPMWAIGIVFGVFLAVSIWMAYLAKELATQKKSEYFTKVVNTLAVLFIALAASLVVVVAAFALFSRIDFKDDAPIWAIGIVFGVFLIAGGLLALLAKEMSSIEKSEYFTKNLAAISLLFVAVAASLVIVAAAFAVMASLSIDSGRMALIGGIFAGFIILVGIFAVLGGTLIKEKTGIYGILAMAGLAIAVAASLYIVAKAVAAISKAATPQKMKIAMQIMIVLGLIIAVLAGIGILAGISGAGIAGLAVMARFILAIGAACLLAAAGIALIAVAFTLLVDSFTRLVDVVADKGPAFSKNIKLVIDGFLDAIGNSQNKISNAIRAIVCGFSEGLITSVPVIAEAVSSLIIGILRTLVEKTPEIVGAIIDFIHMLAEVIGERGEEILSAITDLFTSILKAFWGFLKKLVEGPADAMVDAVTVAAQDAYEKTKAAYEKVQGMFPELSLPELELHAENDFLQIRKKFEEAVDEGLAEAEKEAEKSGETGGGKYASGFGSTVDEFMDSHQFDMPELPSLDIDTSGIESVLGSSGDLQAMLSTLNLDPSKFADISKAFEDLNLGDTMSSQMFDMRTAISTAEPEIKTASENVASSIETPIKNLDPEQWGRDIPILLARGMISEKDKVAEASEAVAGVIYGFLHYSEPDVGPLSNFHTFAPDMIKLWCKGIYDNLGLVDNSSNSMADRIKDGMSTALDYVSSLIDGGMSDELTIRPIMDLSEIQNGSRLLDSMLSGREDYALYGTASVASSAANNMRTLNAPKADETVKQPTERGDIFNNTFNISNNDPDAVAERVSRIIQQQVNRKKAIWATN